MAITVVNVGTAAHANNISVTPTLYTSNGVDDLILNFDALRENADGTAVTCTDYTQIASAASVGSRRLTIFAKVHDGTEGNPTNVSNQAAASSHSAVTIGIRGALNDLSGGTPAVLDGTPQATVGGASDLTIEVPALTVNTDNCIVFIVVYHRDDLEGFNFDTPAGFTKALEADTILGADHAFAVYYQIQTSKANIGATTVTKSGGTGTTNIGLIFALKIAAGGAPGWTVTPTVSSQTATVYTASFTPNAASTIYGVAVVAGSGAPTATQIKAGQNGAGGAAKAANNKAVTGADTLTLTPSDAPPSATYDLYFVLNNGGGDSSVQSRLGEALDPPAFSVAPSVTSQTTTTYTSGFTPDVACTVYGVAVVAGSGAPSATQVKAGQNGAGGAAKAAANKAITGADTLDLTPSDSPKSATYDLHFVLNNPCGDSAVAHLNGEALDPPNFSVSPTVSSQTATVYTVSFTPDSATTIYGVAVIKDSAAPSAAQVIAGQNGTGGAAKAANNKAVSGADTLTLTPSDTPAFPLYDLYLVLSNGGGTPSLTGLPDEPLDVPAGRQRVTLTSVHATSPYFGQGVAAGDIETIHLVTSPDSYAITADADGTVSYAAGGDDSRQLIGDGGANNVFVYDVSAGVNLSFQLVYNNLAPAPNPQAFDDPILVRKSVAMTALDLLPLALDPEGDTVIATSINTLPTGLSVSTSQLVGTPTTYGRTTGRTFRWTDQYGATYDEAAIIEVGDLTGNAVGLSQAAGTTAIQAVASMTVTTSSASSGSVPIGDVISQSPPAATLAPHDQVVELVISLGGAQTAVPNLIGQANTAATSILAAAGLLPGTISYGITPGTLYLITAQSPAASTVVDLNTTVNYTVRVLGEVVQGHGRARRH